MRRVNHSVWIVAAAGTIALGAATPGRSLQAVVSGEPDAAAGRAIALHGVSPDRPGCAACHLASGAGQPMVGIPRLAGLTASYIAAQLGYFASGARRSAVMQSFAAELSPAQGRDVAAYFASLPLPAQSSAPAVSPQQLARGKALFHDGDQHTGLLGCALCHGPAGQGMGTFPRLAGQSAPYVEEQLTAWRQGDLRDPIGQVMASEARHLSPADIHAVAAYVEQLGDTQVPMGASQ